MENVLHYTDSIGQVDELVVLALTAGAILMHWHWLKNSEIDNSKSWSVGILARL